MARQRVLFLRYGDYSAAILTAMAEWIRFPISFIYILSKAEKNGKKKKIINYLLYKSENNYYLYLYIDLIEFWRSKWA